MPVCVGADIWPVNIILAAFKLPLTVNDVRAPRLVMFGWAELDTLCAITDTAAGGK